MSIEGQICDQKSPRVITGKPLTGRNWPRIVLPLPMPRAGGCGSVSRMAQASLLSGSVFRRS